MKIYCIISCLFWTIFCYSQMHDKVELHSTDKAKVVIICTAALIESNYQMRKQEYVFSISLLKDYGYEPYVFEACKSSPPSFFENYTKNVFYSNVNDYRLINKGVNEARSLIEGFKHYSFDDETMIIKLTGRYWLNSPIFINVVESHPEVDAFVRFKEDFPIPNGYVFTGCFAMKHKHFKAMLDQLDFVRDLCAAEDRNKGSFRAADGLIKIFDFFGQQKTGDAR